MNITSRSSLKISGILGLPRIPTNSLVIQGIFKESFKFLGVWRIFGKLLWRVKHLVFLFYRKFSFVEAGFSFWNVVPQALLGMVTGNFCQSENYIIENSCSDINFNQMSNLTNVIFAITNANLRNHIRMRRQMIWNCMHRTPGNGCGNFLLLNDLYFVEKFQPRRGKVFSGWVVACSKPVLQVVDSSHYKDMVWCGTLTIWA